MSLIFDIKDLQFSITNFKSFLLNNIEILIIYSKFSDRKLSISEKFKKRNPSEILFFKVIDDWLSKLFLIIILLKFSIEFLLFHSQCSFTASFSYLKLDDAACEYL